MLQESHFVAVTTEIQINSNIQILTYFLAFFFLFSALVILVDDFVSVTCLGGSGGLGISGGTSPAITAQVKLPVPGLQKIKFLFSSNQAV